MSGSFAMCYSSLLLLPMIRGGNGSNTLGYLIFRRSRLAKFQEILLFLTVMGAGNPQKTQDWIYKLLLAEITEACKVLGDPNEPQWFVHPVKLRSLFPNVWCVGVRKIIARGALRGILNNVGPIKKGKCRAYQIGKTLNGHTVGLELQIVSSSQTQSPINRGYYCFRYLILDRNENGPNN